VSKLKIHPFLYKLSLLSIEYHLIINVIDIIPVKYLIDIY